jgi:ribonuclease III
VFPKLFLSATDKKFAKSLKNLLGFKPKNLSLYRLALLHSSVAKKSNNGVVSSNERLEFLGDSLVNTIVADYLFKKFPFKDEGFLTKMRSKMVSRVQHNKIALKLGINKMIEIAPDARITSQNSIYGNAYEALVGAIYLDRGYSFTHQFITQRIITIHFDIDEIENTEVDFKSKFIMWAQKEKKEFLFVVVQEPSPSNEKRYTIEATLDGIGYGTGVHYSKKRAEQIAAETAMQKIEADV